MAEVDLSLSKGKPESRNPPTVKVEIYNQSWIIRTDGDSEYIRELAEFVDSRMREISETLKNDLSTVAILAALHIADELHRLKRSRLSADEAIEKLPAGPRNGMLQARGLWKDRDDLPDFGRMRREWDRL
jgi:cell division protein ZapA